MEQVNLKRDIPGVQLIIGLTTCFEKSHEIPFLWSAHESWHLQSLIFPTTEYLHMCTFKGRRITLRSFNYLVKHKILAALSTAPPANNLLKTYISTRLVHIYLSGFRCGSPTKGNLRKILHAGIKGQNH